MLDSGCLLDLWCHVFSELEQNSSVYPPSVTVSSNLSSLSSAFELFPRDVSSLSPASLKANCGDELNAARCFCLQPWRLLRAACLLSDVEILQILSEHQDPLKVGSLLWAFSFVKHGSTFTVSSWLWLKSSDWMKATWLQCQGVPLDYSGLTVF